MKFDADYTRAWYKKLGEGEWDRWDISPATKFHEAIYLHHLKSIVAPGDRVLDAGCGAGRFTRPLIDLGADVTALDLTPRQLELCRTRAPGARDYVEASVTDLSVFGDATFDATLCIGGAISYTFDQADQAMAELVRVTRPGGRVLLSVMCLLGTVHTALKSVLDIDPETNQRIFDTGHLERGMGSDHECRLYRAGELQAQMEAAGLTDVRLSAQGFLTGAHGNQELPEPGTAQYEFLFQAELEASAENPSGGKHIIGMGTRP